MQKIHSFHIPVMGIGFTSETPLKVSQYGIDSVISLVDDTLLEKLRKAYCEKNGLAYSAITTKTEDFRAKRITSYLNLINILARNKFEALKSAAQEKSDEIKKYFNMLIDSSTLKQEFKSLNSKHSNLDEIGDWIKDNLSMGSIDVNIMTKIDRENYANGEALSYEYNDAHAALRGYANSDLRSSLILSAGMNQRLYGYLEQFEDFYPDEKGEIKKKIVLKVSDYRSALIQGKFLAKKGLWISEYRIESGLNCGGHTFPTDGYLMGPILAEFRDKREDLIKFIHNIFVKALSRKGRSAPERELPVKITAQGGVSTAEEHKFLINHYQLDSVGWGTPFLLVKETTAVDDITLNKLIESKEDDLYLSDISPLNVPFNNLKGNTKGLEKLSYIDQGKPGSSCPRKYLVSNKEFTEKTICTASRQYQQFKIKELEEKKLPPEKYQIEYNKIVEKECICVGLGMPALLVNNIDTEVQDNGVSVCPGPSMAYFPKMMSLQEIVDHIYGRLNVITRTDRPNMFVKEIRIYIEYLKNMIKETGESLTARQEKYFLTFLKNVNEGIDYYSNLFNKLKGVFEDAKLVILNDLEESRKTLSLINAEIENLTIAKKPIGVRSPE